MSESQICKVSQQIEWCLKKQLKRSWLLPQVALFLQTNLLCLQRSKQTIPHTNLSNSFSRHSRASSPSHEVRIPFVSTLYLHSRLRLYIHRGRMNQRQSLSWFSNLSFLKHVLFSVPPLLKNLFCKLLCMYLVLQNEIRCNCSFWQHRILYSVTVIISMSLAEMFSSVGLTHIQVK